jgi:dolichyl-phosphate beta-glucosyltransferase
MIEDAAEYLKDENQRDPDFKYEIIIVDDGSKDNTSETALRSAEQYGIKEHLKVIKLEVNRGKGGAVTQVSIQYCSF